MTTERLIISVSEKGTLVVKRNIESVGKSARKSEGAVKLLSGALGTLGVAAAGLGIAQGVRLLASFGQTMATVKAVSEATADQFVDLRNKAKELGEQTRFSATEAAEGMLFLSRAGFTANETLVSITDTLKLAQAGALDLGTAADIASNILAGFRGDASQLTAVVDVLAKAANSSNTNVQQLGQAMKFVGPVASGLGISLEETAAAAGTLSDAGLQAQMAGTGLRKILSTLERPTGAASKVLRELGVANSEVEITSVGLVAALQRLKDAGIGTGQALALFGQRGGPAFSVLVNTIPEIEKFTNKLQGAEGTANDIAATMDDTLNGALLRVRSAFQSVIIELGDLGAETGITTFMEALAETLRGLAQNIDQVVDSLTAMAVLVAAIKFAPLIQSIGVAIAKFLSMGAAVSANTTLVFASTIAERDAAAAALMTAEAEVAKTVALIASTQAQLANTIVVEGATGSARARAALTAKVTALETARATQINAVTAAQVRSTAATKASIPILGGLTTALTAVKTAALKALAAIAANPFAAVVIAITAIIALLVTFRNKLRLGGEGTATLAEVSTIAFNRIRDSLSQLFAVSSNGFDEQEKKADSFGQVFTSVLGSIVLTIAQVLDKTVGLLTGIVGAIIFTFKQLPGAIGDIMIQMVNNLNRIVENAINKIITGFNKLSGKLKLPKIDRISLTGLENQFEGQADRFGEDFGSIFAAAFNNSPARDAILSIIDEAQADALAKIAFKPRDKDLGGSDDDVGGGLTDAEIAAAKAAKAALERQKAVDALIGSLRTENELMQMNSFEREIAIGLLEAQADIEGDLTDGQSKAIEKQLRLNQAMAIRSDLMDQILSPQEEFNRAQEQMNILLQMGTITLDQFKEKMGELMSSYNQFTDEQKVLMEAFDSTWDIGLQSIKDFAQGGEDIFRQFAADVLMSIADIIAGLIKLQIQQAIIGAFSGPLGGLGGGGGSVPFAGDASGSLGFAASGANFKVGGVGGVDSQLVQFRATPGEDVNVSTSNQQAQQAQQGMGGVTIVNVVDESSFLDLMGSDKGQKVQMNTITLNRQGIKQAIS